MFGIQEHVINEREQNGVLKVIKLNINMNIRHKCVKWRSARSEVIRVAAIIQCEQQRDTRSSRIFYEIAELSDIKCRICQFKRKRGFFSNFKLNVKGRISLPCKASHMKYLAENTFLNWVLNLLTEPRDRMNIVEFWSAHMILPWQLKQPCNGSVWKKTSYVWFLQDILLCAGFPFVLSSQYKTN